MLNTRPTVSLGYDHGMAHVPGLLDGFVDAADEALYEAAYSCTVASRRTLRTGIVTGEGLQGAQVHNSQL
jgi:hypothetical protein